MENQSLDETNQSLDKAYVDYLITPTVSGNIVNKAVFKKLRFPSDTQRDFFLNAVKAVQNEPNIIQYFGVYTTGSEHEYLVVTKFSNIGNLAQYVSRQDKRPTEKDCSNLALGICHGVASLHKHHIAHGDLHSHNVIIDGNGIPKLTDFGQDLFETIDYQKIERRIPYTAPEVLTNGQHSVEKSSDIYAIGFLIWEIWARKPPFENEEKSQLTEKIIGGKRETFDITTPEIYSNLSKKCWCAERQSRPCIDYCIATLNGHNLSHM